MGTKTSSNIGILLHKVAGSCLLHPLRRGIVEDRYNGVFSSDDEEERECIDCKRRVDNYSLSESIDVQPLEPGEYENLLQRLDAMEALFQEVFDTASTLKNAYIRLQTAHTPYDPEKLESADRAVVTELRKMSELKQSYTKLSGLSCSFPRNLKGRFSENEEQKNLVDAYEGVVKDLKADVQEKNTQIEFLKRNLQESKKEKEKLQRKLKKLGHRDADGIPKWGVFFDCPTPELFKSMVDQVMESCRSFTKLLISLMREAKWDIDAAANSIAPGVIYRKSSHKKYAFESYVWERMFHGFENESFYISGSLLSLLEPENHRRDCFLQFRHILSVEPMEILNIMPDCPLGKFCNKKYLRIVHPKMEDAFFGNFDHRALVVNGKHPSSEFYQTFLKFAKAVWVLHKLAFSFSYAPNPFNVPKNAVFQPSYMETVVTLDDSEGEVPLVAFAISPGFKLLEDYIIKSRVYIVSKQAQNSRDLS